MTVAANIIRKFGGTRPMARKCGWPASRVANWKLSGLIPSKHHRAVLAHAERWGIAIEPAELIDAPPAGQAELADTAG